jgi:hypothetical protein
MKKNKKEKVSSSSTDKMFLEQPVEMTNPTESQKDMVKSQGKILAEKKMICYLVLVHVSMEFNWLWS